MSSDVAEARSALPGERDPSPSSTNSQNDTPSRNANQGSGSEEQDRAPKQNGDPPNHKKGQLALILIALCLAVFLAAIDATIISTSLPTIAQDLGASDSGFAWIGSSYLIALAASAPFWGKVSDIFGRKPMLIIANIVFLVGSLVAALSHSLTQLLVGRALQGTGGGGLITLVEISVGDMFSQRFVKTSCLFSSPQTYRLRPLTYH